jgi:SAM-dependent methyltransferase
MPRRPVPTRADDHAFDLVYPPDIRALSGRFWTPVEVARAAVRLFREAGVRRVLDVGAGVGKFALVAAASAPEIGFEGIEQRPRLVRLARLAAWRLRITNAKVAFGDATRFAAWRGFDGLYFFNPFAENLFTAPDHIDDCVELSRERFLAEALRVEVALRSAALGTAVVTYFGLGGRIPSCYELVRSERARTDCLRLWAKVRATDDGSFFVERHDGVVHCRPHAPEGRGKFEA